MTAEESSIFQKICCCYNNGVKEPPVELIRTHSIAGPTTQVAKETVDGFQEVNLDQKTSIEAANENSVVTNNVVEDEFVLNDIMMDELCGETIKEEHAEPLVEDEISIHTNVVEEVDENELAMITQQSVKSEWNETPQLSEETTDTENMTDRSNEEKVSINQVIKEGYESPGRPELYVSSASSADGKPSIDNNMSFDSLDDDDSNAIHEKHINLDDDQSKISSSDIKQLKSEVFSTDDESEGIVESVRSQTTADIAALLSSRKEDEEDDDSDDEILIEEVPVQMTTAKVIPKSVMYAELSDDDDDDDNDDNDDEIADNVEKDKHLEIIRPPSRSKHHTFHEKPVENIIVDDDKSESEGEVVEDIPIPSPRRHAASRAEVVKLSDTDSDDETEDGIVEEDANMSEPIKLGEILTGHEKENEGITRLSVKSDGKATITNGSVRLALDVRDVTDDEFSEQLI